jgi:hypothetical protein
MMGDYGSELMEYLMYKNMMGQRSPGTGTGAGSAANSGGLNPLMAASMLDSSDLMMMNLLNGNHGNTRHSRGQMMGGYPMMGYSNPMANLMMAETMTGNDLFGGNLEGLGTMALLGGMGRPQMPMMGGYQMYRPPVVSAGATASPYSYQTRPDKYYASHPASNRGATQQFMPQMGGMGMNPMGMGMGMGNPAMSNLFMMNALSGGDLMTNDFAKDLGGVMMMNNMMHRPMMYGGNPYGAAYPYYYAHPTTTSTTPTSASTNTGYASRINSGKRGSIADNLWEMNLIQSWLNPNQQTGAGAGTQANSANANG